MVALTLQSVLAIGCSSALEATMQPTPNIEATTARTAAAPTHTPTAELTLTTVPTPFSLSLVARWSVPEGMARAIAPIEDTNRPYLAVAIDGYASSLALLDVFDPANPKLAGLIEAPFDSASIYAEELAVSGGYAYIILTGPSGGLWTVDVSNPSLPVHISFLPFESSLLRGLSKDGPTVIMVGDYVGELRYDSPVSDAIGRPTMLTVDTSDPLQPMILGAILGSIFGGSAKVAAQSGLAYMVGPTGLHVVDISDPAKPKEVASLADPDSEMAPYQDTPRRVAGFRASESATKDIAIQDGYAYVASGSKGLRIIDISTPTMPVEIGSLTTESLQDVIVSGDLAFGYDFLMPPRVGQASKILVIDISQPESPKLMDSLETKEAQISDSIALVGDYIYAINDSREILVVSYN